MVEEMENFGAGGGRGATALTGGGRGATALTGGGRGATALPRIVNNFKHLLSVRYGLRFQRDFFDSRLRDDAHYAEKFRYVCNNPVRKGLCERAQDWSCVMVFERNLSRKTDAENCAISFVSE